jgi:polygalacturonase
MDIDCCTNVRITNCSVNSPFDDGICLKSSFGLGYSHATENVIISNCRVSGYDEGTMLDGTFKHETEKKNYPGGTPTGRIKMGTESNGGFKNIIISNCQFEYCRGLALETVDGGIIEDININNILMRDVTSAPIFLRLGARMRGPKDVPVGKLRRVNINNVQVYNADWQAVIISGIPGHDIEDIKLNNIKIYYKGGGTAAQATRNVPEMEKDYPEPNGFGTLPAYGFFIRHVNKLQMDGIDVSFLHNDERPALILNHVTGAALRFVHAQTIPGKSSLKLENVQNVSLHQSFNKRDKTFGNVLKKEF